MSNTLGRGLSNPWAPLFPLSHHPVGLHWLALIGCIKHTTDFLIILHMVMHGLVPCVADTSASAALGQSHEFLIPTRTHKGKRLSCYDLNDSWKYVTHTEMASFAHDSSVFSSFLLTVCRMWGPEQVLTKCNRPCRLLQVQWCHMSGTALWVRWHRRISTDFQQVRWKLFWHFKCNTSVRKPQWPLMCPPILSVETESL